MSDPIKHECGIALIRLLKPLKYYKEKYDDSIYGFHKLFLLMEKQHNRGQDGAGIGAVKIGVPAGQGYIFRNRNAKSNGLAEIFTDQFEDYADKVKKGIIHPEFVDTVKANFDYGAELLIGHLRYGTGGSYSKSSCHPFFRKSTWPARNLMLLGNFGITNSDELNKKLVERGIHPVINANTPAILEEICYHLDIEHAEIYRELRDEGYAGGDILRMMNERLNVVDRVSQNIGTFFSTSWVMKDVLKFTDEEIDKMKEEIIKARENLDSVGGVLETYILPNDLVIGEPYFNSIESKFASYLFSIGGVKGVEFGLGFDFAKKLGSEVSDELTIEEGKVVAPYNYNGGINGGISNLQPIVVRCAIKPTPSIYQEQKTINIKTNENVSLNIKGRHDPAIIHRARVVVDSLIALALLDLCAIKLGNEWLR